MARRRMMLQSFRSIAGAVLAGSGMFVLYEHLAAALGWLSHVLGSNAPGVVPAIILAVAPVSRAHLAHPQCFLQDLLRQTLASSWPVLLVMVGTALSGDAFPDNANSPAKI